MITFSRYEIRTEPEGVPLLIYAADWEAAEQTQEYREFLSEQNPRSIQIMEQKYSYSGIAEEQVLTFKEIVQLKDDNELKDAGSGIFYKYFGNKEIQVLLTAKLEEEFYKKMSEWEKLHEQNLEGFYEQIKDICVIKTVFENLVLKGAWYAPEYIERLAALDDPLEQMANAYAENTEFDIRKDMWHPIAKACLEVMNGFYDYVRNPKALDGQSDEERMQVLKEAIEKEYAESKKKWNDLSFEEKVDAHLEIFTISQFYRDLKEHMSEYSALMLYCLGAFEYPLSYDTENVIAIRTARKQNGKELSSALAKLFPDMVLENDPWEIWDIRQNAGFTLKKGLEVEYKALENLNNKDGYGLSIFAYLKRWASAMEQEIEKGVPVKEIALLTSEKADINGITGAMYSCAVATLSKYWEYGEQLREWHNEMYCYRGQGVTNPAVLVMETKEAGEQETISPQMSM